MVEKLEKLIDVWIKVGETYLAAIQPAVQPSAPSPAPEKEEGESKATKKKRGRKKKAAGTEKAIEPPKAPTAPIAPEAESAQDPMDGLIMQESASVPAALEIPEDESEDRLRDTGLAFIKRFKTQQDGIQQFYRVLTMALGVDVKSLKDLNHEQRVAGIQALDAEIKNADAGVQV